MNTRIERMREKLKPYETKLRKLQQTVFPRTTRHDGFTMLNLLIGFVGAGFILGFNPSNDISFLASSVYTVVTTLTCSFLILRPIMLMAQNRGQAVMSVVMQIAVTICILSFIDTQGDIVIRSVREHPQVAIAIIVGYFIAGHIYRLSSSFDIGHTEVAAGRMAVSVKKRPSERDLEIASVHEAGHALIYAAAKELPDTLTVELLDRFNRNGVLGSVSCEAVQHSLMKKSEIEFHMYLCLAGMAAEQVRFGEFSAGTSNDLAQWNTHCETYLSNGFGEGRYLPNAVTSSDREANAKIRATLHSDQMFALSNFFGRNWKALSELANELRDTKTLKGDQLAPYFDRVDVPKWLPEIHIEAAKKAEGTLL